MTIAVFKYKSLLTLVGFIFFSGTCLAQYGRNDTLIAPAIIYQGDTLEAKVLAGIYLWQRNSRQEDKWTRLRNAVYVTYPYARKAGYIFKDIQSYMDKNPHKEAKIKRYIRSREKELRNEFTTPLKNLSVYQGKILMKLINRETGGIDCFNIVKQLKGGVTARFWQTVAFLFGSDLKQPYDAIGKDVEIEQIVKQVQRLYGYSG